VIDQLCENATKKKQKVAVVYSKGVKSFLKQSAVNCCTATNKQIKEVEKLPPAHAASNLVNRRITRRLKVC
jgi:hypothetical protein